MCISIRRDRILGLIYRFLNGVTKPYFLKRVHSRILIQKYGPSPSPWPLHLSETLDVQLAGDSLISDFFPSLTSLILAVAHSNHILRDSNPGFICKTLFILYLIQVGLEIDLFKQTNKALC